MKIHPPIEDAPRMFISKCSILFTFQLFSLHVLFLWHVKKYLILMSEANSVFQPTLITMIPLMKDTTMLSNFGFCFHVF